MQASAELDVLRSAFRSALLSYNTESNRLAELLICLETSTSAEDLHEINRQQERVNNAQARYTQARKRYVSYVLGGFVASGNSAFIHH